MAEAGDDDGDVGNVQDGDDEESRVLEEIADQNPSNTKNMSNWYKLFDIVTSANPSQVVRYSRQQRQAPHPLWMGDHCQPESVPKCQKCKGDRIFEFQLTP